MTPGPHAPDADTSAPDPLTPADLLTPHDEPEQVPVEADQATPHAGIVDPRRSRSGPEILEPPTPGVTTPPGQLDEDKME